MSYAIGVDLGGTNIKYALVHKTKGIEFQNSISTQAEKGVDHIIDRIATGIKEMVEKASTPPIGVGLGSPGTISLDRKWVANPPNFPGWEKVDMTTEIYKRTKLRALVDNDANLAALGSSRFGAGKAFDSFIMVTLGTGVGGGIILNRDLFRGASGGAGEFGHVTIDYHGPLSNSKVRGCIEAFLGQRFMSRFAAERIAQDVENPLFKRFHNLYDTLEPVHLFEAAEDGNELAIEILHKAGEKLGYGIINYCHVLDINKVVVSGGVAKAGEYILEPARKTALASLLPTFAEDFELIYEPLGNDAAILGAASLAFEYLDK
jgi:glucokinase